MIFKTYKENPVFWILILQAGLYSTLGDFVPFQYELNWVRVFLYFVFFPLMWIMAGINIYLLNKEAKR